ncbi:hypothetical protein B0H13DRAFT_2562200 [Mycena leptocephala]|nr:hypothetical protein B0H13DRAFT_2562200 [Mycena leptocephala]
MPSAKTLTEPNDTGDINLNFNQNLTLPVANGTLPREIEDGKPWEGLTRYAVVLGNGLVLDALRAWGASSKLLQVEFQCKTFKISNAEICWPFEADQPIAAVHLSETLNVAFHLMEVRSGKGLQPLYSGRVPLGTRTARRGEFRQIIDQCRSEVGTEKRRNAEGMRNKLPNAWAPSLGPLGVIEELGLNQEKTRFPRTTSPPPAEMCPTKFTVLVAVSLIGLTTARPMQFVQRTSLSPKLGFQPSIPVESVDEANISDLDGPWFTPQSLDLGPAPFTESERLGG